MPNDGAAGQKGTSRKPMNKASSGLPAPTGGAPNNSPVNPGAFKPIDPSAAGDLRRAQTREAARASKLLMDENRIRSLDSNIMMLDAFINHSYMAELDKCKVQPMAYEPTSRNSICLYEMTKLMLSENEDTYEKLVSLYASLHSIKATIGILLQSDSNSTHIYLFTSCNDYGVSANLLHSSVIGHFPGSRLIKKAPADVDRILTNIQSMPAAAINGKRTQNKYISTISIVPSRRTDEQQNHELKLSAQGMEKFIDGMLGKSYTVLFLAEPLESVAVDNSKRGFESLFTLLSPFAKETVSYGENESDATNFALSVNMSQSISEGVSRSYGTSHTTGTSGGRGGSSNSSFNGNGYGFSSGSCWNSGWSSSDSTSQNIGTTQGTQSGKGEGEVSGDSHTTGLSRTINLSREIKTVQNCLQRLEAEIQRIETNRGFGMWNCCCYVLANDINTASVASSSLQSLLCGDAAYGGNSYINLWSCAVQKDDSQQILKYLSYMSHPILSFSPDSSSDVGAQMIRPSLVVSGRDLPTLLNLPRRSVPGLQVLSMAEFGRNFPADFMPKRRIEFGNVMHMGIFETTKMLFDLDRFASHCFICGAAGSGKSNTTYNLLQVFYENKIPFLVIEPVKGEYKMEFAGMPGIQVFTSKPDSFRMLSINPFEFHKDVHIKEHLDHLNSVVTTCWPLYGPMPAMLKEAFEEAYISCGWDLELSERIIKTGKEFPTFADVLPAIEKIINESTYSSETKGDYKGALCMRVRMLMNGFEGLIFGNTRGISDAEMFEQNTIIDLSNIGNPETRSLIMGILIIKLREYRFATQTVTNSALRHITVLEEAHNILKRCSHETSQDSGNVQGAAVAALVDCIAEMRSSGEGFLIIDQSPGAVDEAAIKNTAIKIVMRTPEKNDCEAIGNSMNLREDQMRELSRFDKGVAAVFHEGWDEAVLGKMGTIWSTTPHAKAYRMATVPVIRNELLRTKGAICQWLCALYIRDALEELETMTAYDKFVRDYRASGYTHTINDNIWLDIRQQIKLFLVELKDKIEYEFGSLSTDNKVIMKLCIGQFIRRFLQIDGIFRLCPLKLPQYDASNVAKPSSEQFSVIEDWWFSIKDTLSHYVLMPVRCHSKPLQWTANAMDGEHMKFAMQLILKSYGEEYTRAHEGLSIYECAYFALSGTYLKA